MVSSLNTNCSGREWGRLDTFLEHDVSRTLTTSKVRNMERDVSPLGICLLGAMRCCNMGDTVAMISSFRVTMLNQLLY
jgi:hypothetical protein